MIYGSDLMDFIFGDNDDTVGTPEAFVGGDDVIYAYGGDD